MTTMRCVAITTRGGDRCNRTTTSTIDGVPFCRYHRVDLMNGHAIRLIANWQARIAHDCNGNNPELRIAPYGVDHPAHDETRRASA